MSSYCKGGARQNRAQLSPREFACLSLKQRKKDRQKHIS